MVADPDFTELSLCLSSFKVTSKPAYEKELEKKLTQHLQVRGYNVGILITSTGEMYAMAVSCGVKIINDKANDKAKAYC